MKIYDYYLLKKRLSRFLFFFLMFCACILSAQTAPDPQIGDFQTRKSGNWGAYDTWQVYTATGWVNVTSTGTYPGSDATTAATAKTYNVFVQPGHEVNVTTSYTFYFGDIFILANNPVPNIYPATSPAVIIPATPNVGRVNINNSVTFKLLGVGQDVFVYGGVLFFSGNSTVLGLNEGSLIITNYNGFGLSTGNGSNGIQPIFKSDSANCTGNQQVIFYNSTGAEVQKYGVCNGSNSPYTFWELNNNGGSISAVLTAPNTEVCAGQTVQLTADYTGAIPNGKIITYTLQLDSGPAGYTFTTLSGSFVDPGTATSIPDPNLTLTDLGTYVYSLKVSYPYDTSAASYQVTSTRKLTLTVNATAFIKNMSRTVCNGDFFTITPVNGASADGVVPANTTYSWTAPTVTGGMTGGAAGSGNAISGNLVNPTSTLQTATYTVTPKTGTCVGSPFTVTVSVKPILVTGTPNTFPGGTTQLTGSPLTASDGITAGTWVSSDPTKATVSSSGLVTGVATGTSVIKYTVDGCSHSVTVTVGTVCNNPATASTSTNPSLPSKFGITTLNRASSEDNGWPGVRKGAYMVLEAKARGFVLPRMTTAQISNIPTTELVEGMVVYNTSLQCINVYNGTSWKCFKTQTCP